MNKKNKIIILSASLIIIVLTGIAFIAFYNTSEEESGVRLNKYQPYVGTNDGVILTMSYDKSTDSFKGIVYNPTFQTLDDVRVEVHLYRDSASYELGPTEAKDLAPGESRAVELSAKGWSFDTWTAHPEASSSESEEGEHEEGGDHD